MSKTSTISDVADSVVGTNPREKIRDIVDRVFPRLMTQLRVWNNRRITKKQGRLARQRCQQQYNYDRERLLRFAPGLAQSGRRFFDKDQWRSVLTIGYHRLEKGMSLPEPRPGFGIEASEGLCKMTEEYIEGFGFDDMTNLCIGVMEKYVAFNGELGVDFPKLKNWCFTQRERFASEGEHTDKGGTRDISRGWLEKQAIRDLTGFFESRFSIRSFADEPVSRDTLQAAVRLAQRTPSVCNRQAWRVYVFESEAEKESVLKLQNGNRGFGHTADKILVVTTNLKAFYSSEERNQCWVDGGMFSMSLVYALHSMGVASCCLNWCVSSETDQALKSTTSIGDCDAVIMVIAVGYPAESFRVAKSERKPIDDVMFYNCEKFQIIS